MVFGHSRGRRHKVEITVIGVRLSTSHFLQIGTKLLDQPLVNMVIIGKPLHKYDSCKSYISFRS